MILNVSVKVLPIVRDRPPLMTDSEPLGSSDIIACIFEGKSVDLAEVTVRGAVTGQADCVC